MITKERYSEFLEHFMWQRLKTPDYRLGQAFLNYFPEIGREMVNDSDNGTLDEYRLFNETNDLEAQKTIDFWIDQ